MTFEGVKNQIDAIAAGVNKLSKMSTANRLARFDRETSEMIERIQKWERFPKDELQSIKDYYTEVRTGFVNAMAEARRRKEENAVAYRHGRGR